MSEDGPNPGYVSRRMVSEEGDVSLKIVRELKDKKIVAANYSKIFGLSLTLDDGTTVIVRLAQGDRVSGNILPFLVLEKK